MTIETFLQMAEKFEIQVYEEAKSPKDLKKDHVCYVGTPQKHPLVSHKVILVNNFFSTNTSYYEFRFSDISCVEKLPSLVDPEGEVVTMARIWVKKRALAFTAFRLLWKIQLALINDVDNLLRKRNTHAG